MAASFFWCTLQSYDRLEQFLEAMRQADSYPFAAAQAGDVAVPSVDRTEAASAAAVPARDYRLTNNTATFTVETATPGVAVLTEAYVPGDFR